jgi:hypothetical protein
VELDVGTWSPIADADVPRARAGLQRHADAAR